jgi:hypothetical protein
MPKSFFKNEINVNESLLDKGLKVIIQAFNEQKNEFSQRLSLLQSENKKLKEENFLYKNKLTSLQQKLNSLSKTALLLDEETEDKKIEEKKIMEQVLNNDIHLSKNNINNILNKSKNNIISRNDRTSLGKNTTTFRKKKFQSIYINNENQKLNSNGSINIKHKRTNSNNFKNLKYSINYPQKTTYMKAVNYLNNDTNSNNSENISNNIEKSNNNDIVGKIDLKDSDFSEDNDSKLYKRLNLFLEACKMELNAIDYENILELLKSFETNSDINVKKKIKKIINNRSKLDKLLDDIFESS